MKHLGVHWDMRYDGATIYQLTLDNLEAAISRLRTFPCSSEIKQAVLERCIYPSLIYQMKFANWQLAKYRELNKRINALIKRITKFPNSFPTALIYMGKEHGGLNFKRLSDAVHSAKLSLLHRYQGWNSTSPTAAVMWGLIGRAPRTAGLGVPPFESCNVTDTGKGWQLGGMAQAQWPIHRISGRHP